MNYVQTLLSNKSDFILSARLAIILGVREVWRRCGTKKPHEPDLVAGLVLESTKILIDAWGEIFERNKIQFSLLSVYCHQSPKVSYSSTQKSCELGDILFVHIHRDSRNNYYNNSLLYQVKLSSKQPYRIPQKEYHQLSLYLKWPDFQYISSGRLNRQKRSVNPKIFHPGAQYLLIDDRPPHVPESGLLNFSNSYPIGSCMPSPIIHDHNPLEKELFDFLLFKSGRPFRQRKDSIKTNGWSRVIWDLIEIGVTKSFNRKRSGFHQQPRISSVSKIDGKCECYSTLSNCITSVEEILWKKQAEWLYFGQSSGSNNIPPIDSIDDNNDENGVSLVLIETWDMNENE